MGTERPVMAVAGREKGRWSMHSEIGQEDGHNQDGVRVPHSHRISWFVPDRPVAGTVFVRPDSDEVAHRDR